MPGRALTEAHFVADPQLVATLDNTVVLGLEGRDAKVAGADLGAAGLDEVPYDLPAREVLRLCVEANGEADQVTLTRDDPSFVPMRAEAGGPCVTRELDKGRYRMLVTRDPRALGAAPKSIFIRSQAAAPPQCPPSPDPLSRAGNMWMVRIGDRVLQRGNVDQTVGATLVLVPLGDYVPERGLEIVRDGAEVRILAGGFYAKTWKLAEPLTAIVTGSPGVVTSLWPTLPRGGFELRPLPDSSWSFSPSSILDGSREPWQVRPDRELVTVGYADGTPVTVTLAMRYAPRAELVGPLATGEVALYQGSDYQGPAFVLNETNLFPTDFYAVDGMWSTLVSRRMTSFGSIRFGCDTSVDLYPGPSFGGAPRFRGLDTPRIFTSLDDLYANIDLRSARVRRTRDVLIQTNQCTGCNLARVDLEGLNLSKVTLQNVDMTDARLAGAVFDEGSLTSVRFDGADLRGASFRRARFKDVSFARTDLRETTLDPVPSFALLSGGPLADPCAAPPVGSGYSRFAGATVRFEQLPPETWPLLDLSDVRFDTSQVSGTARSLAGRNLCGLRLARVALTGFTWNGVRFDGTDLTGADLSGAAGSRVSFERASLGGASLSGAVLQNASFRGADLTSAKLDEATVSDADFETAIADDLKIRGATLKNVLFPRGRLVGLKASYAALDTVDLQSAILEGGSGATFYAAILRNVDLSNARISNVSFNRAFVEGGTMRAAVAVQATFTFATLANVSLIALQGQSAQLTDARLAGVDFTNAAFTRNPTSGLPATFEHATFCGGTFSRTDLSGARLTDAIVPAAPVPVPGPNGGTVTCQPVDRSGILTSALTTCPNGDAPSDRSACAGDDWKPLDPRPPPCCVPVGDAGCPARLRPGASCKTNCDCRSEICSADGTCAS